MRVVS
ncbi:hypothetical protein YPPY66_1991, partial [Yersinia pestis PY-66]